MLGCSVKNVIQWLQIIENVVIDRAHNCFDRYGFFFCWRFISTAGVVRYVQNTGIFLFLNRRKTHEVVSKVI